MCGRLIENAAPTFPSFNRLKCCPLVEVNTLEKVETLDERGLLEIRKEYFVFRERMQSYERIYLEENSRTL